MLENAFPGLLRLARYRRRNLRGDLQAGLTVAVLLIPQAMAYAMLAGLPPVVGLYASVFPLLIYALVGSSRHLAIGPTAVVSLLVFAGCSELAEPGSPEYIALATLVALLAGCLQLVLGLLRLGVLVSFVSHAVITGFSAGAAILICLSQLKHILGIELEGSDRAIEVAGEVLSELGTTHGPTAAIGLGSLLVLIILQRKAKKVPAALLLVAISTVVVWALGLDAHGVKTVGDVPRGLPALSLPRFDVSGLGRLVPTVIVIAAISYMESIALVQLIAARERYKVFPNVEMRAIGMANIVSGLFSGYPITGSFSRTAVNYEAGARTRLAALITAAVIIPALVFLTPLFYYMPSAVLGAIIVVAAVKLIDIRAIRDLCQLDATDGVVLLATLMATLFAGIEVGILAGVASSLVLYIWRSSHPHMAELGFEPREGGFHDIERFPAAWTDPRLLVFRIDRSIYFANAGFIVDGVREAMDLKPDLQWIILDLSGVNDCDGVALHVFSQFLERCEARKIHVIFSGMKGPVRDRFGKLGWLEEHEAPLTYATIEQALEHTGILDETVWP